MASVGTLALTLLAQTKPFTRGIDKARAKVKAFGSGLLRSLKKVVSWGGAITAVATGGGLALLVKNAFGAIDAIAKLSDKLDIGTEALVGMQHAANLSGVSAESLGSSLTRMTRRIGLYADGSGAAARALERLGFKQRELLGLKADVAFSRIADRIAGLATHAERSAAAFEIFGNEGQDLLPILEMGSKGLAEMQAEAEKLGLTFDRVDAKQIENANDAFARMKALFVGIGRQVAIKLAPFLEGMVTTFVDWATEGEGAAGKVQTAFEFLLTGVGKIIDFWRKMNAVILQGIAQILEKVGTTMSAAAEFEPWLRRPAESVLNAATQAQIVANRASTKAASSNALGEIETFLARSRNAAAGTNYLGNKAATGRLAGDEPREQTQRDQLRVQERSADASERAVEAFEQFASSVNQGGPAAIPL